MEETQQRERGGWIVDLLRGLGTGDTFTVDLVQRASVIVAASRLGIKVGSALSEDKAKVTFTIKRKR